MKVKVMKSDCHHIRNIINVICYTLPLEINGLYEIIITQYGNRGAEIFLGQVFGSSFYPMWTVSYNPNQDNFIFTEQNMTRLNGLSQILLKREIE